MQKNFDFQNDSQFTQAYEDLLTSTDFQRLQDKYTVKPFYFKYKSLKMLLSGLTWFIQAVTVAVSFVAIFALLVPMMPYYVAVLFAVCSLLGIEFLKRMTFTPSVKEYLQFKKIAVFPLLIALSMLCVSLWLTYNGTHEAVTGLTEKPTLLSVDSVTAYEKDRIRQINADISSAKKITWQGKITEKGQKIIEKLANERAKIQDKLDAKETNTRATNDQTTTDHNNKTLERSTHFKFLTVCLDLLLFVLLAWLEFYDFRSLTEFSKLKTVTNTNAMRTPPSVMNDNAMRYGNALRTPSVTNDNAMQPDIPFSDNNGRVVIQGFKQKKQGEVLTVKKACQHCGNTFERKTTFQKYCTENCRIRAWEQRNGKPFRKPKSGTDI